MIRRSRGRERVTLGKPALRPRSTLLVAHLILWSLTRRVVDRQNEHAFAAPVVQRMLFAGCRSGLPTVFGYREHVVEGELIS